MRLALLAVLALSPSEQALALCGTRSCQEVIDEWNAATRRDVVAEDFSTGAASLATARWLTTEGNCTGGEGCPDQLRTSCGLTSPPSVAGHSFCGVTDEHSNVLLAHAMGTDRVAYEKLHRFTELLRVPSLNGLQCWKYRIDGVRAYEAHSDVCFKTDSASDSSLRILHAYSIACAKQRSGAWPLSSIDFCADYLEQGDAIWGHATPFHGEIRLLDNGEFFLANGFMNQTGAPTATESFRPDYYELQPLYDFAEYRGLAWMKDGVLDMLEDYLASTGSNAVHCGKKGHFDATTTVYSCDELCDPPRVDETDTWRAIPALAGLLVAHRSRVPDAVREAIFDQWWERYSGGHPSLYRPRDELPFEIACGGDASSAVLSDEASYKTLSMWIPLAAAYDRTYLEEAVDELVEGRFDWRQGEEHFYGAAYYGAYFSQFAQRAIGAASGMLSPWHWTGIFRNDFESGDLDGWMGPR